MRKTTRRAKMILDLPMVSEEAVKEAIEYFRRKAGVDDSVFDWTTGTIKKKPARGLWDAQDWEWWQREQRIDTAIDNRIRRDRYRK